MDTYRDLYRQIRGAYNKGKQTADRAGAHYVYYFMRPLSFYVTPLFVICGISANAATQIGTLAGLIAAVFLFLGGAWLPAAGVLILISEIMDHVDGNLARHYGSSGYYGKFLDSVGGTLQHAAWLVALCSGLAYYGHGYPLARDIMNRFDGPAIFPVAGAIAATLLVFDSLVTFRAMSLSLLAGVQPQPIATGKTGGPPLAAGWKSVPRRLSRLFGESFALMFIVLSLLRCPDILFLAAVVVIVPSHILSTARTWIRTSRELGSVRMS